MSPHRPIHSIRIWPLQCAIWQRESAGKKWYDATFTRQYKDGNEYKSSATIRHSDLLTLSQLSLQTWQWINRQSEKDHAAAKSGNAPPPADQPHSDQETPF